MFRVTTTNPFERFYDTEVTVVRIKKDDYSGETVQTELNFFTADIQPYSGGKAYEEYGVNIDCQKRMFCGEHDNISVNNHVKIGGEIYEIVYVEKWGFGYSVMLKRSKQR